MSLPSSLSNSPTQRPVWSVSELTLRVKDAIEADFSGVAVRGEISNLSRPGSGHCYFTLKDDRSQIRAVLWQSQARRLRFDLRDGLQAICIGDLEVYPPRGTYQIVVRELLPCGQGGLELALRQLRERLAAEGLFDPARKRPLPPLPRRIAIVTSPTGAALHDFLQALAPRWRGASVVVLPVRVQGDGASREIAAAMACANRLRPTPDVIVVTRGGGSLEDLWAFNEEPLIRAIVASTIPVVSAVGHEIDVTLADLAADVRALTPTDAASRVAPTHDELTAMLAQLEHRVSGHWRRRLALAQQRLQSIAARRLWRRPEDLLAPWSRQIDDLEARLKRCGQARIEQGRQRLRELSARVEALSPLGVLARGYSLTLRADDGRLVRRPEEVRPGERIVTRLERGQITSQVEQIEIEGQNP